MGDANAYIIPASAATVPNDRIHIPAETTLEGLFTKSPAPTKRFEKVRAEFSFRDGVPSATMFPNDRPNNKWILPNPVAFVVKFKFPW